MFALLRFGQPTLAAFGLTEDVIDTALTLTDEAQFEALCDALPELQGCALLALRAGKDPDEVYADLIGSQPVEPVDTDDVAAALARGNVPAAVRDRDQRGAARGDRG